MSKYDLVPFNYTVGEELEQAMTNTLFNSVENFIGMYNSGLLNRSYSDTKNILDQVKNTYKNVAVSRGAIIVLTHEEYMSSELVDKFSQWKGLSRLRRELRGEIERGSVNNDSTLYLGKNGLIYRVDNDKMYTTRLVRVLKESWDTILRESSVNDTPDTLDFGENIDEEYSLENPYENTDTENEDVEEENEIEEDTVGTELPENAKSRMFKAHDILAIDDSFIREIYELMPTN